MTHYLGLLDGKAGAYGIVIPDLPGALGGGATFEATMRDAIGAAAEWAAEIEKDGGNVFAPSSLEELRRDRDIADAIAGGAALVAIPLVREAGANDTEADDKVADDIGNLWGRILRYNNFKSDEAEKVLQQLRLHSRRLKGKSMRSKRLLHSVWSLIQAFEQAAPGMGAEKAAALQYAASFRLMFAVILDNRCDLDLPRPGEARAF